MSKLSSTPMVSEELLEVDIKEKVVELESKVLGSLNEVVDTAIKEKKDFRISIRYSAKASSATIDFEEFIPETPEEFCNRVKEEFANRALQRNKIN
ncbi:hypothetical protein [Lachnoanaerobaculum orale]|uniref:hypothetical protein n=1 Tax=Lachnoanaerobaculum orale TaxID=979627 RepID=UPI0023A8A46D|nr:hypothetical protein [Lachnoanaerobaculum orale]